MIDFSHITKWDLGKHFDYSVLPKDSTEQAIRAGCRGAVAYNCAAFYAASTYWAPVIKEELAGSDVRIATAIAFPFGSATSKVKVCEVEEAVELGCSAIDLVMNIGALKSGLIDDVRRELADFKAAAGDALTKVILETAFLTDPEIVTACQLIAEAELDYAKTASGQFEGPSLEQFLLMKQTLEGTPVKLKVAGVKFPRPQNAYAFMLAGADLIGTRAAPEIIDALDTMRAIGLVAPAA